MAFGLPAEAVFDFLVDPHNRALWQSSLRRVQDIEPAIPAVGQTWTDVTVTGLRPAMETIVLERPTRWTERGAWRGIRAELTLLVTPVADGCLVEASARVTGGGLLGRVLTRLAPYAVRPDLERAARLLSARAAGQ